MTRRPGVSLTELIIALSLFSAVLVTALGFYRQQAQAFTRGNERIVLMQNLRYGVNTLEQNLRAAGVGVPASQPVLVYGDANTLAFNANYASRDAADPLAVYHDPRLPAGEAGAVGPDRRFVLPGTAFAYPDAAYVLGSEPSPAETIVFHFAPDKTTPRRDDWVLYRQVNGGELQVIARHLVATDRPFFTYHASPDRAGDARDAGDAGDATAPGLRPIPAARLPLRHAEPIHGAPGDTGAAALIDSVRAVRVSYGTTGGGRDRSDTQRRIDRLIPLPNVGLDARLDCGAPPVLGTALAALPVPTMDTEPGHVLLAWNPASDEWGGERDVVRYVIWRKRAAGDPWGDPLVSIAAGASRYEHQDRDVEAGERYWYALAAQDCAPRVSARSTAGPVTARD